jgi:hypothetical protein
VPGYAPPAPSPDWSQRPAPSIPSIPSIPSRSALRQLDVAVDNIGRSVLWARVDPVYGRVWMVPGWLLPAQPCCACPQAWGSLLGCVEWLTFTCLHTQGPHWKTAFENAPWFVAAVMRNGTFHVARPTHHLAGSQGASGLRCVGRLQDTDRGLCDWRPAPSPALAVCSRTGHAGSLGSSARSDSRYHSVFGRGPSLEPCLRALVHPEALPAFGGLRALSAPRARAGSVPLCLCV